MSYDPAAGVSQAGVTVMCPLAFVLGLLYPPDTSDSAAPLDQLSLSAVMYRRTVRLSFVMFPSAAAYTVPLV